MIYRLEFRLTGGSFAGRARVKRSMEVAGSATLEQVCSTLLESLEFDFDHLYEFEIHGNLYEGAPPYGPGRDRCRTKVMTLGLKEDDVFRLIYDFGDAWIFLGRVAAVIDEKGKPPRVVESEGHVTQYPDEEELAEIMQEQEDDLDIDSDRFLMDVWDYEPSDELFDAAYRYKKTKLWTRLKGEHLFAVRFRDGNIGYISVMGSLGEHCALGVYPGAKGLDSFRRVNCELPEPGVTEHEWSLSQDCLQIVFDQKKYLNEKELEAVQAYGDARDLKFRGRNAYAHFMKFKPAHFPWYPQTKQEEGYLLEAAEAAIAMADHLQDHTIRETGLHPVGPLPCELPCVQIQEDGKAVLLDEKFPIGILEPKEWPMPSPLSASTRKRVRKMPAIGTLDCRLIMLEDPVQNKADEMPSFPMTLIVMDSKTGPLAPPELIEDYEEDPDIARDQFINMLEIMDRRPKKIRVSDPRTQTLMAPLALQIGSELELACELPEMDEFLDQLFSFDAYDDPDFGDDDRFEEDIAAFTGTTDEYQQALFMLEIIAQMPNRDIPSLPPDVRLSVKAMIEAGEVPPDLAGKLKKKLKL